MDTAPQIVLQDRHLERCDEQLRRGERANIISAVFMVAAIVAGAMLINDVWPPRQTDPSALAQPR